MYWKNQFKGDLYISLIKHEISNYDNNLPIDPYILGCLLGNGHLYKSLSLSSGNKELINLFSNKLLNDYCLIKNGSSNYDYYIVRKKNKQNNKNCLCRRNNFINFYKKKLFKLRLLGKNSYNKFIPDIYKESSYNQRLELIRGLMDTDGESTNGISYSTTSYKLALDIQYLIRSIGGLCKIKERQTYYKYKGIRKLGRKSYRLNIRHQDPEILFNISSKKDKARLKNIKNIIKLRIESIEHIGKEECQCILIDHPDHLYVTDDFIVTHNTLMAQTIAKILKIPFTIADSTSITSEGYVGENIESIFQPLLQNYNVEEIEKSVIFIDEIDKKARKTAGNPSITRDVSGEDVQFALLKLIEGKVVNVQPIGTRKHPHQQCSQIDTTNILFILGGAFVGLSNIVSQRLGKNEVGFSEKTRLSRSMRETELLKQTEQDDLIQFGLIPELVGRMPIITVLDELQIEDLSRILTEPKDNLIDQYTTLLKQDNVNISFPEETIKKIAQIAYDKRIGARGLKSVIEKIMLDFMFEVDRNNNGDYTIEI